MSDDERCSANKIAGERFAQTGASANEDRQTRYPHACARTCYDARGDKVFSSVDMYTRAEVVERGFCSFLSDHMFCCSKRLLFPNRQMCRQHYLMCRKRDTLTERAESKNWRPRQILRRKALSDDIDNQYDTFDAAQYRTHMERKRNIRCNIQDLPGVDVEQIDGAVDFLAHMWLQHD